MIQVDICRDTSTSYSLTKLLTDSIDDKTSSMLKTFVFPLNLMISFLATSHLVKLRHAI